MTGWLRIALTLQIGWFAFWGGHLLTSHRDAGTVWLATEPVDPRDLLSGTFVALRYRIGSPEVAHCEIAVDAARPLTVWVRLEPTGDAVPTEDGAAVSEAVECRTVPPDDTAHSTWIMGRLGADVGTRDRIFYGIERMYVGEDSALRTAKTGSVVAEVAINDAFEPRIVALVSRPQDSASTVR